MSGYLYGENVWLENSLSVMAQAISEPKLFPYQYPNFSQTQSFCTYLPMKMEQA